MIQSNNSMTPHAEFTNPRVSDFNVRNHSSSESNLGFCNHSWEVSHSPSTLADKNEWIGSGRTFWCQDYIPILMGWSYSFLHSRLYKAFTVVFCREFVTKLVLIKLQCFYFCWAVCALVKGYSLPATHYVSSAGRLEVLKLPGNTTRTTNPNSPLPCDFYTSWHHVQQQNLKKGIWENVYDYQIWLPQ